MIELAPFLLRCLGEDGMVLKDPKAGSRKIMAVLKLLDKVRWKPLHASTFITVPT